ncbi:hypothetical protein [Sphingomonas sp. DT-204]|uniref:hypothetical protein n=1 Tax=Sphingomonas sp. DT-204 TaxID=3396166 RepID=UPI003F1A8440
MFNWIAGLSRCSKGWHERSEKHIAPTVDGSYVSICRYCRTRMKRRAKRDWSTISRAEFDALIG